MYVDLELHSSDEANNIRTQISNGSGNELENWRGVFESIVVECAELSLF